MTTLKLDSLNLSITVPEEVDYKYDGEVDDIHLHTARFITSEGGILQAAGYLAWKALSEVGSYINPFNLSRGEKRTVGRYVVNNTGDGMVIRTFIKKGFSPTISMFLRGHEETHLLLKFFGIEPLDDLLVQNNLHYGCPTNRTNTDEEEYLANIGGQLAVLVNYGERKMRGLESEFNARGMNIGGFAPLSRR